MYKVRQKQKANQMTMCPNRRDGGRCYKGRVVAVQHRNGTLSEEDLGECEVCGGSGHGIVCAICETFTANADENFDFHHWDYEKNIGVFLCRDCHEQVHSTECAYPENDDDWIYHAISNALNHYREFHDLGEIDDGEIENRLNLPPELGDPQER